MDTTFYSTDDPSALPAAVAHLQDHQPVAFPTDTVYGLAALVRDAEGIERLYEAKGREGSKAIAVLVGSLEQLAAVTPMLDERARRLAAHFWPGALTLVIPRRADLPDVLSPNQTIGVRMPDHPFALALLRLTGPLATTSANRSGEANPLNAQDVLAQLGGRIALVLDGGPVTGGVPSTVVDCTQPELKILRQGAISAEAIFAAVNK
jgi:L-threonylcarbamoyladenylate synthase